MERLSLVVGYCITVVWTGSMVADFAVADYDPPAPLHGMMLLVAGAFFGKAAYESAKRRNGNGG